MQKFNSTIIPKKKNLSCGHFDYAFSHGRCKSCATIDSTQNRIAKAQETPMVSDNLRSQVESSNAELNRWFEERRKEMTGVCKHCGGASCMKDNKYFKFSIAHILPKAYFPSVATHPENWLELCFWQKSCHTQMDNKMLDLIDMACFDEIVVKFQKMYPAIAAKERKRIPDVLLQYVGTDF